MDNALITIIFNSLGLRYLLNLISVFIVFRFIYFKNYKNTDLFLTFFGFNSIIFFISFMLNKVEISTGAGFGLFAVFSVLRYRTEGIGVKDMTYLFLSISIGLLTAIGPSDGIEISLFCFLIILLTLIIENSILGKKEASKIIVYDSLDFINESQKQELVDELKRKTGIEIHRISVDNIDYLKDSCTITIYYYEK
ncbi:MULTISPECIES: DUF4956 domain-containing protein [Flavobacterium]|uniref:DUF4956 domain-containing protein n=1 Tax=Flavobacterium keumense TaxID=1306518 RepID=A0ABY8N6U3_9FLAO|nr:MULTISPECIES: DUF4956 domain-containing protein [Flavobacterium]WGK95076.1 DUF4956 domain-containing protein [Flavobacterium keumense]